MGWRDTIQKDVKPVSSWRDTIQKDPKERSVIDDVKDTGSEFLTAAKNDLSGLGAMAGGTVGGVLAGPPGAIVGAGFGGAFGSASKNAINHYFNPEEAPKEAADYIIDPIESAAGAMVGERAGFNIGNAAINGATKAYKYGAEKLNPVANAILKKAGKVLNNIPEEYLEEYLNRNGKVTARTEKEILDEISSIYSEKANVVNQSKEAVYKNKERLAKLEAELKESLLDKKFQSSHEVGSQKDAFQDAAMGATEQLKQKNVLGLRDQILNSIKQLKENVNLASSEAYEILGDAKGSVRTKDILNHIDRQLEGFKIRGNFATEGDEAAYKAIEGLRNRIKRYGKQISFPEAKAILQSLDRETQYSKNAGAYDDIINRAKKSIRTDIDEVVKRKVKPYKAKMKEIKKDTDLLNTLSDSFGTEEKALGKLNSMASIKGRHIDLDLLHDLGTKTGQDFKTPIEEFITTKDLLSSPQSMKALKEGLPEFQQLQQAEQSRRQLFDPATRRRLQEQVQSSAEAAELAQAEQELLKRESEFAPVEKFGSGLQSKVRSLNGARDYEPKKLFEALDQATGKNFTQEIRDRAILDSFNKSDTQGSRKTLLGKTIGGAIGGALGYGTGHDSKSAALGAWVGFNLDRYSGQVLKALLDAKIGTSEAMKELGPTLGKYAPILVEAANRGPEALAAVGAMLNKNSDFQNLIRNLEGER